VAIAGVNEPADWRRIRDLAVKGPDEWVLQRRFEVIAVSTPEGLLYPCLGVYVIDGRIAGAYGRMAERPLIDDRSLDVAILLRQATGPRTSEGTNESRSHL
jgi:hypothetical protein